MEGRLTMNKKVLAGASLALGVMIAASGALAQGWPKAKPVRILTGYPPGGPTEVIGHVLAEHLSRELGATFYMEGKPGAAGNLAGELMVNSPRDGYTLNIAGLGILTVNKELYGDKMSYDPATAFAPITILVRLPVLVEASAKIPPKTFAEFVAYAKANPGKLNHGSPGIGTLPHLAAELMAQRMGFKSEHIAYRGTGPFSQGMMQGELQWAFDVPQTAMSLSKNGHAKLLAVSGKSRNKHFPDVPTLEEVGMSDTDWTVYFALVGPTGMPKDIIAKLNAAIVKGWKDPAVTQRLVNAGVDPYTTSPEEMAKIVASDRAMWSKVVRDRGIKVE